MNNSVQSGGTISIESHSKQIKLLNDYIISLQKKLNELKEQDNGRVVKLSEENNKLATQNVKIRN